jgi:hypothetical protein
MEARMQNYEVTGNFITFGIGIEIRLSTSQADTRAHLLKNKKKDIYEIISPVQFKKGEQIGVYPKSLSKALLENLKELGAKDSNNDKKTKNDDVTYPCIQHVSFGKYNVFDQEKNLITDKPIKKDEAEKLLEEILKKNEAPDDNEDQDNQNPDDDLEDIDPNV